jgi:hypothetical protein
MSAQRARARGRVPTTVTQSTYSVLATVAVEKAPTTLDLLYTYHNLVIIKKAKHIPHAKRQNSFNHAPKQSGNMSEPGLQSVGMDDKGAKMRIMRVAQMEKKASMKG